MTSPEEDPQGEHSLALPMLRGCSVVVGVRCQSAGVEELARRSSRSSAGWRNIVAGVGSGSIGHRSRVAGM